MRWRAYRPKETLAYSCLLAKRRENFPCSVAIPCKTSRYRCGLRLSGSIFRNRSQLARVSQCLSTGIRIKHQHRRAEVIASIVPSFVISSHFSSKNATIQQFHNDTYNTLEYAAYDSPSALRYFDTPGAAVCTTQSRLYCSVTLLLNAELAHLYSVKSSGSLGHIYCIRKTSSR